MERHVRAVFAVTLVAVGCYALWAYRSWPGQWQWTFDAITGSTVLTGPLVGALAAALRWGMHGMDELRRVTPRGWWEPFRAAVGAWLVGMAAYAVTAAAAVAVTLAGPHGGPVDLLALAAGPLVLAVCALAGAVVVQWLPHLVVVVAVAPGLFLLGAFGPSPFPDVLRHGPSTGTLAGLQLDVGTLLARAAAGLGLSLCLAAAMLPWASREGAARRVVAAALAGSVLVAGAWWVAGASDRWAPSAEEPTSCAGAGPQVCVSPSSVRRLEEVEQAVRGPAEVLTETGARLPDAYDEELPYREGDPAHGVLTIPARTTSVDPAAATMLLLRPAPCPAWSDPSGPPPAAAFDAQLLIAEWVAGQVEGDAPTSFSPQARAWLATADDAEVRRWVVQTFDLLLSCRLDAIRLPWGRP